jgi:uncharacterized protein
MRLIVFISALFRGFPEQAYEAALGGRCALIVSPAILAELARTLRGRFHTAETDIVAYVRQIGRVAEVVRPTRAVSVLPDQEDNRVLECAEAGRVDLIVPGDPCDPALTRRAVRATEPTELPSSAGQPDAFRALVPRRRQDL